MFEPLRRRVAVGLGAAFALAGSALVLAGAASATSVTISGSMEGALQIKPGDTVSAGYDFTIPGEKGTDTVSFAGGSVSISGPCKGGSDNGKTESLKISLPDYTQQVSDGNWYPSGDQSSSAVWQGSTKSNLCAGGYLDASKGATFSINVGASDTSQSVHIRFHYKTTGSGSWSSTQAVTPTQSGSPSPPPSTSPPAPTPTTTTTPAPSTPPSSPSPQITIRKLEKIAGTGGAYVPGPITGKLGQTVDYKIIVTNTGSVSVTIALSDSLCNNIVAQGSQSIAAGKSVVYTCTHVLTATDGSSYTNTATATGTAAGGKTANAGPVSVVANVKAAGTLAAHVTITHKAAKARKVAKVTHRAKKPKSAVGGASFTG